jgi:transcriptional regulator with XRE-family HTH domain
MATATTRTVRRRATRYRPERARVGATLRRERGLLTQQQLADAAKLHRVTIARLEEGRQRPTAASVWKIAALRTDLRSRVALDERLGRAAGTRRSRWPPSQPDRSAAAGRAGGASPATRGLAWTARVACGCREGSHVMRPARTRVRARRAGLAVAAGSLLRSMVVCRLWVGADAAFGGDGGCCSCATRRSVVSLA